MRTYLIVGNGVAGNWAAESIRKNDPSGKITLFTKERYYFYYTPALPEFISGEKQLKDFTLHDGPWYERNRIDIRLGTPVTAIDPDKKTVTTKGGEVFSYDRLLLACGGYSFIPPIQGSSDPRVFTLRRIDDGVAIRERAKTAKKAVVIGGGLLGLEAGNGLRKLGLQVSVVEFATRLLPRQMDIPGALLLQKQMERMGFRFHLGAQTKEIIPEKETLQVLLQSGERIEADLVLISAGVRPELTLAKALSLKTDKGVIVDDTLKTQLDGIYAAGDLIEHRGRYYGIWPAAMEQGRIAGANMAGKKEEYRGTVPSNTLKVLGIDLVSTGEIDDAGKMECLVARDEARPSYRKLVLQDGRIVGAILLGDVRGKDAIQKAIQSGQNISPFKKGLAEGSFDFGKLS